MFKRHIHTLPLTARRRSPPRMAVATFLWAWIRQSAALAPRSVLLSSAHRLSRRPACAVGAD